jgi:hypothetical protein
MTSLIRGLLIAIAIGIGFISVAMTFRYGLVFVKGEERFAFALLFGAVDAAKCLLPSLCIILAAKARRRARITYLIFALCSVLAHIGLVLTVKGHDAAGASVSQTRYTDATGARDDLKRQVRALEGTRALGKIEADIKAAELDARFASSKGCTDATVELSRGLCKKWEGYKGEKVDADMLADLRTKLDTAQQKVDGLTNMDAMEDVAVVTDQIAANTGLQPGTVMIMLALLIAMMVELGSSKLLEIALDIEITDEPKVIKSADPAPAEPEQIIVSDEPVVEEEIKPADNRPVLDPREWLRERTGKRKGTHTPYNAMLETYQAEAEGRGMRSASGAAFSRAMTAEEMTRDRIKGDTMVLNVMMKAEKQVAQLRAV